MIINMLMTFLMLVCCTISFAQTAAEQQLKTGIDAYTKQGSKALARQSFVKALELDNNYAAPRFNLAQLAEEQEQWADAVNWYSEYLKLDKTSPYADVAERKVALLKKYIESDKTPEGKKERIYLQYLQKAQANLANGHIGAAIAYSELATEYNPERFEAHLMYAAALMENEHYPEAIVKLNLASNYAKGAEKIEIANLIERCNESLDQESKIRNADSLFEKQKYADAAAAYGDIWIFLNQPNFGFLAAHSWVLSKQEDKAIKIYDKLAKEKNLLVAMRAKQEKADLESDVIVKVDRKPSSESKVTVSNTPEFVQAIKLMENKKYYEADSQLTQVLDGLLPGSEYAVMFYTRGVARNGLKEYQGAIQDFTLALMLDPHMIDVFLHRAESYAGSNQYLDAVKDMDRAIELSSGDAVKENLRKTKKIYLSKRDEK